MGGSAWPVASLTQVVVEVRCLARSYANVSVLAGDEHDVALVGSSGGSCQERKNERFVIVEPELQYRKTAGLSSQPSRSCSAKGSGGTPAAANCCGWTSSPAASVTESTETEVSTLDGFRPRAPWVAPRFAFLRLGGCPSRVFDRRGPHRQTRAPRGRSGGPGAPEHCGGGDLLRMDDALLAGRPGAMAPRDPAALSSVTLYRNDRTSSA
jgi:hypothetical protein